MSPSLKRTLVSGLVFFAIFSVLSIVLQYRNEDFSLSSVFVNAFFVTMLYVGFTWLIRRITGSKGQGE